MNEAWAREVLGFWFTELTPDDWFASDPASVDARLRARFSALPETLARALPAESWANADAALAAILVFDQFPRNLYRGTARAFATDPQALGLARNAVDKGFDQAVEPARRLFVYLPFEHSEVSEDQEKSVALVAGLSDPETLRYAEEHRAIIGRFGRFPHRNRVLNRPNTPDEERFLAEHKGFGQ